jgi:energy-coupling factor transporter transmembrane protein EcfT
MLFKGGGASNSGAKVTVSTALLIFIYIIYSASLFLVKSYSLILLFSIPVIVLYIPSAIGGASNSPSNSPSYIKRGKGGVAITFIFAIFIFISNLLNPSGEIIFKKGPLIIGEDSLEKAFVRAGRLILLVLSAKALLSRYEPPEILKGLQSLLGPLGRHRVVKNFIETAILSLKALPGVKREFERLYNESCRKGNIIERLRAVSSITVLILSKAIEKPEEFF